MGNEYQKIVEATRHSTRSSSKPGGSQVSSHPIIQMQQAIGNHTLVQLLQLKAIQAKLTIGQAGDTYEQEADRVADQVMRMPHPEVQRQTPEEEEEKIQASPLAGTITPIIQRQQPQEEEESLQAKFIAPKSNIMQKQSLEEEQDQPLQAKEVSDASRMMDTTLESNINSLRGGGQPLPDPVRDYFEPRFGYDFSQVRVHTDSKAAETAQSVNARAYTLGNDLVFNQGAYEPDNSDGKKLLAHELTHVIQQNGK